MEHLIKIQTQTQPQPQQAPVQYNVPVPLLPPNPGGQTWRPRERPRPPCRDRPGAPRIRPSRRTEVAVRRSSNTCIRLAAGIVVQTRELWDELNRSLQDLSVRLLFELSELPPDWPAFLDRIDRVRPDVILLDVTKLREPLEEVIRKIRSTAAQPAVFALHTTAEPAAILDALRAGASEYLYPPLQDALKAALERLGQTRERSREARQTDRKNFRVCFRQRRVRRHHLACHVATELPRLVHAKVLLADLDMQAGLVGFLTKSKSPYSLADAVTTCSGWIRASGTVLISNGIPDLEIITAPSAPGGQTAPVPAIEAGAGVRANPVRLDGARLGPQSEWRDALDAGHGG